jgi:hypothetical protein
MTTAETAVNANASSKSDLTFPGSSFAPNALRNFVNGIRRIASGKPSNPPICPSGSSAPSSDGGTHFGTSHNPVYRLMTSPKRCTQKITAAYHQSGPSQALTFSFSRIMPKLRDGTNACRAEPRRASTRARPER